MEIKQESKTTIEIDNIFKNKNGFIIQEKYSTLFHVSVDSEIQELQVPDGEYKITIIIEKI